MHYKMTPCEGTEKPMDCGCWTCGSCATIGRDTFDPSMTASNVMCWHMASSGTGTQTAARSTATGDVR